LLVVDAKIFSEKALFGRLTLPGQAEYTLPYDYNVLPVTTTPRSTAMDVRAPFNASPTPTILLVRDTHVDVTSPTDDEDTMEYAGKNDGAEKQADGFTRRESHALAERPNDPAWNGLCIGV
jgi:hypothetical protein